MRSRPRPVRRGLPRTHGRARDRGGRCHCHAAPRSIAPARARSRAARRDRHAGRGDFVESPAAHALAGMEQQAVVVARRAQLLEPRAARSVRRISISRPKLRRTPSDREVSSLTNSSCPVVASVAGKTSENGRRCTGASGVRPCGASSLPRPLSDVSRTSVRRLAAIPLPRRLYLYQRYPSVVPADKTTDVSVDRGGYKGSARRRPSGPSPWRASLRGSCRCRVP